MEKLQQKIHYQFKDISLLKLALTHRSMGKNNNERLEFLGDSVLGSVISIGAPTAASHDTDCANQTMTRSGRPVIWQNSS